MIQNVVEGKNITVQTPTNVILFCFVNVITKATIYGKYCDIFKHEVKLKNLSSEINLTVIMN